MTVEILNSKLDAILRNQREISERMAKIVTVLYETDQVIDGCVTAKTAMRLLDCSRFKLAEYDDMYQLRMNRPSHHRYSLDRVTAAMNRV